jgi:hypothetical protein
MVRFSFVKLVMDHPVGLLKFGLVTVNNSSKQNSRLGPKFLSHWFNSSVG